MKLSLVEGVFIKVEPFIIISKCLVGNAFLLNSMNITTIQIGIWLV
ncbi:hypothetical protein HMPREF9386_0018 [Streptococcus sanguinis SK330]|uniref:Uncharacterized protein n=1 Tax=Streptococcus sanguinis SK330 TaxID=888813 RepID=F2C4K3_STRSA|nr:hypothetical protein HMPREF9386_0018 [Streptococcus sanguinis SK330]